MKTLIAVLAALALLQTSRTPQSVVDELLAADRGFGAAAAKTTVIPALTAMFADDIAMPVGQPAPGFARGKAQAIESLKLNPDNATGTLEWSPIRGGVSADGLHGFTVGYMTLTKADNSKVPAKYVAYWVRRDEGWRVAVYKRVVADQPPASREMMPPSLPGQIVAAVADPAVIERHKASLQAAEALFSDDAQKIGLGPAFAQHGRVDAVNVGARTSPTFVVSAAAIGKSIGGDAASPLHWAADEGTLVASSGDLGVNFGYLRPNTAPPAGQPSALPFITIWRRAAPGPWQYIAE